MHLQNMTFDRVFSVYPKETRAGKFTEFGFETCDGIVYHARVPGHPTLLVGIPLLVATPRPHTWTCIYGWRNLNTHEVTVEGRSIGSAVGSVAASLVAVFITLRFVMQDAAHLGIGTRALMGGLGILALWALVQSAAAEIGKLRACMLLEKHAPRRTDTP